LGPSDLSITLSGGAELEPQSKDVDKNVDKIAKAAVKAKKIAGAYCASPERARELERRGYRFLAIGSDTGFLRSSAAAVMKKLKA
jgi:4-hydroxy-2-oxoheptanedioate aldolase